MLLQAVAGEIEELRCGLEIDFRADDVLVAKICRQPWELSVNIHPIFGPGREAMDSESMSELVGPRSSPSLRWLHVEIPKDLADRVRGGVDRK